MELLVRKNTQSGPVLLLDPLTQGRVILRRFRDVESALPAICELFGETFNGKEDLSAADKQVKKLEELHEHDLRTIDLLEADIEELKERVQKLLSDIDGIVNG